MTDNNKMVPTEMNITSLGQIFAKSGYFQDARDAAQAIVKILAGQELGLPPIASMTGINIIKGKVSLSAVAMATVLKRHGGYDYRVLENTETACEIEYLQEGESIGKSRFTLEDAKRAKLVGKDNYQKYPRNMLFARAMSNGIRWYCPDVLGGPTYTPGELDEGAIDGNDDGEVVEGEIVHDLQEDIDDFAEWLEVSTKIKQRAEELADGMPLPAVIDDIMPTLLEEFQDFNEEEIRETI